MAVKYRNEYVKEWGEKAAGVRFNLRREERDAYDAVASADSPDPLDAGDLVEVKACKRWVDNGDDWGTAGRWYITESSHETLREANGYYCLLVYDTIPIGGTERMVIHGMRLIPAGDLDEYLKDSPRLSYAEVFPEAHPSHESNDADPGPNPGPEPEEPEEERFAISNREQYPDDLRELDIWLLWCFDGDGRKVPRAPWMTDTCYPVAWGSDTPADERPETTFEEAHKWSQFGPEIQHSWPFPPDAEDKNLKLGMLLPHEPPEPPIMQIDLDNVRNPETGAITPEAATILDRFSEAYAQVSTSGTGIHIYVRAALPAGMGKLIEPLGTYPEPAFEGVDELPQIELYDHGRFVAITGQHIEGSGTAVPEAQQRVGEVIEAYESKESEERRSGAAGEPEPFDPDAHRNPNRSSSGNRSPYFDEPIKNFGEPKSNQAPTGEGFGGAHPGHGGTSSSDGSSTNYAVNTGENIWHCFAHNTGGGPLSLVAVIEGELDCYSPDLSLLSDEAFARVCLLAREKHGFSGDPPYRAVRGVARSEALAMADESEGVLGRDCYSVARQIYDSMGSADI